MTFRVCIATLMVSATVSTVLAESRYPDHPIHLVVGFPAGSAVDSAARLMAPKLGEALGQPVVVENVLGAGGNIALERVSKAPADGYTLAFATNGQIITNPMLYRLSYNSTSAFAPISELVASPNILVVPKASPAMTFSDLIALAKGQPGALTYASGGAGSSPHLSGALLSSMAGLEIRHIPYRGVVAALPDLLADRLAMMFSPITIVLPSIRAGGLRALATTSLKRTDLLPAVPTVAESGFPGFDVTVWLGLLAPAGTPSAIVSQLHRETAKALEDKKIRGELANLGLDVINNSPQEFDDTIKSETRFWEAVIRREGIKAE